MRSESHKSGSQWDSEMLNAVQTSVFTLATYHRGVGAGVLQGSQGSPEQAVIVQHVPSLSDSRLWRREATECQSQRAKVLPFALKH